MDDDKNTQSSTTTKAPGNGGPIIQQSQESEEYQRALQTVVGTALGVILLVVLLALFFLLYRIRLRNRARLLNGQHPQSPILNRSISVDVGSKPVPSVLVLYAYDCAVHEAVVVALSGLLMETCGVTVSLDTFEESVIMERGLEEWLEDRLQEADFIIVVCSLGARLRCSKKRVRFKEEPGRGLPDYFAVAVDYVAEKLRVERSKGLGVAKFVCVVMDYSRLSDIPPQLESASVFNLMRDYTALCTHLTASGPNVQNKPQDVGGNGDEADAWQRTEAGVELWAALGQARDYYKAHPNWLEDRIEPLPPQMRAKPRRRRRRDHGSHEQSLLPLLPIDSVSTSSVVNINTSANVVLHMNSLPTKNGSYFTHSRQNSLPSSLCSSHPPGSNPTQLQQGVSRSVDSFPTTQPGGVEFGEFSSCLVCQQQQEGWGGGLGRKVQCPIHPQPQHPAPVALSDTDGDSELELGQEASLDQRCSRSKSLPHVGLTPHTTSHPNLSQMTTSQTVLEGFSSSLSRSRTVLQAEVHKEWGPNKDGEVDKEGTEVKTETPREITKTDTEIDMDLDSWRPPRDGPPREWAPDARPSGRTSPSSLSSDSSGSTHSAGQSGSDSLERDLRSITMPRLFDHAVDSSQLFSPQGRLYPVVPPRSLSSSALMSFSDSRIRPVPCLTPLQPVNNHDFGISLAPLKFDENWE